MGSGARPGTCRRDPPTAAPDRNECGTPSLGRSPKYVPPVRDLNLVRRLDLAINEAARCVAHELVDQWRAEGAHADRWPTITGAERQ